MSITEIDIRPSYPLVKTTSSREVARPALPWGVQGDLIGVDGSLRGGLRPFHGMEKIYELDFYAHDLHDETSRVNYFKNVHFRIGSEHYGFGFVYRAVRSRRLGGNTTGAASSATVSNTTATGSHSFSTGADLGSSTSSGNAYGAPGKADVFIDFWNSATDSPGTFGHKGEILMEGVDPFAPMSVVVVGRLIYVFVAGRDPARFYVEVVEAETSVAPNTTSLSGSTSSGQSSVAASYTLRKLGRYSGGPIPGPGRKPVLTSPHNATPLGQLAVPGQAVLHKRPMVGQIVLTSLGPTSSGMFSDNIPGGGGGESLSGRGSSSFFETSDFGQGTDSTSVDEVTSDGFGSNRSMRSSSSSYSYDTLAETSSSSISYSQTTPSSYSDPTSACNDTSGTASVGNTPPKILASAWVASPRPFPPLATGAGSSGLLNLAPESITVSVQGRSRGDENPFANLVAGFDRRSHIKTWQLFICDLDDYAGSANGPSCLDTPVASGTVSGDLGSIALTIRVKDYVTLKPGHTYLWGLRLFNANTKCGILVGNADEALNPGGETVVDAGISEADFVNNVVGGKYKFRVREEAPPPGSPSSDDPSPALGKFAAEKFEPGDYVFSVQLNDSKTGLKSAISEIAQVRAETFDQAAGTSSELSDDRAVIYMVAEFAYDPTKFDQAYIFRSVKAQDAGGTLVVAVQHLEAIIKLEDYHTNRNQGSGQWASSSYKHVCYWYKLEDKQLIYQLPYKDETTFDESMPKGGSAVFYGNTMFVSQIRDAGPKSTVDEIRPDDAIRGVGETRWSSTYNYSPELFAPSARFVPTVPTSEMIAYSVTAGNCIGFGLDRLYLMRRDGVYFKPQDMHEGYGLAAPKAFASHGSTVWYMTTKGLKQVTTSGELSDLGVMDHTVINDWVNALDNVSMAYDAVLSAIFVHNPTLEQTAIIWMNTLMFTQVNDMVFTEVDSGVWPRTYTDYRSELSPRAMFLQNSPGETATDLVPDFKPRIFVVDHDRSRTDAGGDRRVTLLDVRDIVFETIRATTTAAVSTTTVTQSAGTWGSGIEGSYLYVLDSPTASFIGKKAKVIERLSALSLRIESGSDLVGLPSGSRVGVSPIYFQWTGANVPIMDHLGQIVDDNEYNIVRQLQSLGCSFVDVSGSPVGDGTTDAKYEALAFRGTSTTPTRADFPRDTDGDLVASVQDYESIYWAAYGYQDDITKPSLGVRGTSISPGVRIYCPDLDFRLLSAVAKATILATERTQRP